MALTTRLYTTPQIIEPCPKCSDGTLNDGVRSGTCSAGQRQGRTCDSNGTSPNSFWGNTSLDCPPEFGGQIGFSQQISLADTTGAQTRSLTAASPLCRGILSAFDRRCLCDTCNDPTAKPCMSNADCPDPPGPIGPICGGKRCSSGANAGQACNVPSECPAGGCTVPGLATQTNGCDTEIGGPAGSGWCYPDTLEGPNEGECAAGPFDCFCSGNAYFQGCTFGNDAPCAALELGSTCTNCDARDCYLDNGVTTDSCIGGANPLPATACAAVGTCPDPVPPAYCGGGEIVAQGVQDAPLGEEADPTLAALYCLPPSITPVVNSAFGYPGPARIELMTHMRLLP
jgi:hypothetical protein